MVGLSGRALADAGMGLVVSTADVRRRVDRLIRGEDAAGLGDRHIPLDGGDRRDEFRLDHRWSSRMYVVNEAPGTGFEVALGGINDGAFIVADMLGRMILFTDDTQTGPERGSATTTLAGPHFVVMMQFSDPAGTFEAMSDHAMSPYFDPDDGRVLAIGKTIVAQMDYPGDIDAYLIELEAGQTVKFQADSVTFDPVLIVDFPGSAREQIAVDNNSGGGILGLSPTLEYTAPFSGTFWVVVQDSGFRGVGGYFLTVSTEASP